MMRPRFCIGRSPIAALAILGLLIPANLDAQTYQGLSTQQWMEALKSEDVRQRWYATLALARIGPGARDAVPSLMVLLSDRSQYEYVRAGAAFALGHICSDEEEVIPLLAETLESDLASVRRNSARALGRFGSRAESAVPQMHAQLRRNDPVFRIDLAEALWRVSKHERAVPFLAEQLRSENGPGSFEAVESLGRIALENESLAIDELVKALGAGSADVTRSAARSLGRIGSTVLPRLSEAAFSDNVAMRRNAIEAYSWMGPAGASGLIRALSDSAPVVRQAAVRGLGKLGPEVAAVEPALLRAVNDADPEVRKTAATALKTIGRVLP